MSVGTVRDAVIAWSEARYPDVGLDDEWELPVVAEAWDGWLNDLNGFHVKTEHAFRALDSAASGPVRGDRQLVQPVAVHGAQVGHRALDSTRPESRH